MIGVVMATHGKLAEEFIRTAEGVAGKMEQTIAVSVVATEPDVRGRLKEAIQRVAGGECVLLLTDLLAASPTNPCLSFLTEPHPEGSTGANLPIPLKPNTPRPSQTPPP